MPNLAQDLAINPLTEHTFRLTAAGGAITTIGNFFGANSNIVLIPSAEYIIDIECFFLKTTSGTVVWTFTNSAAPTSQNITYRASAAAGIVAPAGSAAATYLEGTTYNDATAALALTASAALTDAVNHYAAFRIHLRNDTGTSLKIQATVSAGSITPGIGSRWRATRMTSGNVGTFAA